MQVLTYEVTSILSSNLLWYEVVRRLLVVVRILLAYLVHRFIFLFQERKINLQIRRLVTYVDYLVPSGRQFLVVVPTSIQICSYLLIGQYLARYVFVSRYVDNQLSVVVRPQWYIDYIINSSSKRIQNVVTQQYPIVVYSGTQEDVVRSSTLQQSAPGRLVLVTRYLNFSLKKFQISVLDQNVSREESPPASKLLLRVPLSNIMLSIFALQINFF